MACGSVDTVNRVNLLTFAPPSIRDGMVANTNLFRWSSLVNGNVTEAAAVNFSIAQYHDRYRGSHPNDNPGFYSGGH